MVPGVIVLANGKGGAGKSTLARCLASHFLATTFKPAIVDADPQGSIIKFHQPDGPMGSVPVRADPESETVQATIAEFRDDHSPVIVDTAGFRNQTTVLAILSADVVLIPVKPASDDLVEAVETYRLVQEINSTPERQGRPVKAFMVMTMTVPGTRIARHIRNELVENEYPVLEAELAHRVVYPELSMEGLGPSLVMPDSAAARDVAKIATEITERMAK